MNKQMFINNVTNVLKKTNIDNLYLGLIIKAVHWHLPGLCMFGIMFCSKYISFIVLLYISVVSFLFYHFNNCFISIIENELLKDYKILKNLNVVDPFLNLLKLKINNNNRKYISIYVFCIYYISIVLIFISRFLL